MDQESICLFSSFSQLNDKGSTKFDCIKACLGFEPWTIEWQMGTNPLSYGGPTIISKKLMLSDGKKGFSRQRRVKLIANLIQVNKLNELPNSLSLSLSLSIKNYWGQVTQFILMNHLHLKFMAFQYKKYLKDTLPPMVRL